MSAQIALLLDGLILIFLCVTIFYAARLSMFLKTFREGRAGMQVLIRDLTTTIASAEVSIATTKTKMGDAEKELRTVINEAKFLSDELRYMNEGGDNLANRLEKLAERNRELIDLMEKSGGIGTQTVQSFEPSKPKKASRRSKTEKPKMPKRRAARVEEEEDIFAIKDFDLNEMDADDEEDFQALEDGAYRAAQEEPDSEEFREEINALRREILNSDDDEEIEFGFDTEDDDREEYAEDTHQEIYEEPHQPRVDVNAKSKVRSFAIFDRELAEIDLKEKIEAEVDELVEDHSSEFYSKAEQDLYEALQRRKKAKGTSS